MVEAATEFRKSGFNDEDAANLALVATTYQNVADDALSAGEASNFIISQMKAFGIEAENATHIIDALNEVSNNFAVSSSDLSNNIGKASAALATGNTTYEETLGLFTGITEITRNASRAARGLVSIQSRLTQVLDESSSTGKALVEIYDGLGIALYDSDGQLRSLYDVLYDLNKQWEGLDTNTKDYIALTQAGSNQTQNFLALMSNFETVMGATATAMESAGSAMQENTRYMESLEAKTNQLKATFQDLANNVVENELVKVLLNLTNTVLKGLNNEVGHTVIQFGLLTGVLTGGLTIWGTVAKNLAGMTSVTKTLVPLLTGTAGRLGAIASAALPLAGIIAGVAVAGWGLYNVYKEVNPTIEEATTTIQDNTTTIENNKQKLEELNSIPWFDRTPEIEKEIAKIKAENDNLQDQIEYYKELNIEKAKQASQAKYDIYGARQEYRVAVPGALGSEGGYYSREQLIKSIYDVYGADSGWANFLVDHIKEIGEASVESGEALETHLLQIVNDYNTALETNDENAKDVIATYNNNKATIDKLANSYRTIVANGGQLTESQQALLDAVNATNAAYIKASETERLMSLGLAENAEQADVLIQKYPELKNGVEGLTKATIDLIAKNEIFANQDLNVDSKIKALGNLAIAAGVASELVADAVSGGQKYNVALRRLTNRGLSMDEAKEQYASKIWESWMRSLGGGGGGVSNISTGEDTYLQSLKDGIALLKSELELLEAQGAPIEDQVAKMRQIQDALHRQAEYLRSTKASQTDINKLSKEWWDYEKKITGEKENQAEAYERILASLEEEISSLETSLALYDEVLNEYVDKNVEALEAQKEALQEQNDELDKQIEKEQALDALARARQTQVLVYKDGRYQYVQDADAVSEAQSALEDIRRNERVEAEIKLIDEQIEKWEDYRDEWAKVVKDYSMGQDALIEKQRLGTKLEADTWKERLNNLKNYKAEYQDLIEQLGQVQIQQQAVQQQQQQYETNKQTVGDIDAQMAANSAAWHSASESEKKVLEQANRDLAAQRDSITGGSSSFNSTTGTWTKPTYANGTTSAAGGLSLVGEQGPELRVLGHGDGIIPADITKNLWAWGATTPASMMAAISGGLMKNSNMNVRIENLNLPGVKNGNDFVQYMKNNFWRQTVQFTTT